jgi:protein-S-isoprenylcysteine O-methyltransferase Ste14
MSLTEETTFRLVFAALFLLLFGVVGTYRRNAHAGRRIDYSKEGGAVFVALRLGGLFLWLYCFLYIFSPGILNWSFVDIPSPVRWGGAAMVLLLLPLVVSAQQALGRNVSPTVMIHEDHELVTSGPYRWIRNPLYTAGGLILAGLGLLSASLFLLAGAAIALMLVRVRLPREESELEARFGQEYRDYASRTGRFFPPLWK